MVLVVVAVGVILSCICLVHPGVTSTTTTISTTATTAANASRLITGVYSMYMYIPATTRPRLGPRLGVSYRPGSALERVGIDHIQAEHTTTTTTTTRVSCVTSMGVGVIL